MCSAKRTRVIDDESDYFATDSNQWLSSQQRSVLRSKDAALRAKRHASRYGRSQQVTLDFAGRRVIDEDYELSTAVIADDASDIGSVAEQPQFNADDFTVDLVNPNIRLSSAPQVGLYCWCQFHTSSSVGNTPLECLRFTTNFSALAASGKCIWAVKLCCDKFLQLFTAGPG